jgi:GNAT superfamily N-acetyltransferase
MSSNQLDRITAFLHHFTRAQASDIIELEWGFVHLQSEFPQSYSHNQLVVTDTVSATHAIATADQILGDAGLAHRYVSFDLETAGEAAISDFVEAGYEHEPLVTMIHDGRDLGEPAHAVRAVTHEVLRPALVRDWRVDLPDATDEAIDQLADRTKLYARGAEVAFLAVFDGDQIAARAELYLDRTNAVAQFESLVTHPDFRGRGYAGALVRDALRRSISAGCELSFLVADAADWPRDWYARLGYNAVSTTHDFIRS